MIIALEGPDGCGKSTLMTGLTELTGIPGIKHAGVAVGSIRSEYDAMLQMETLIPLSKVLNFFVDRHLMTNMVYSQVFDQAQKYWDMYMDLIGKTDIVIVYINVPMTVLLGRIAHRKQKTDIVEHSEIQQRLPVIKTMYEQAWAGINHKYPNKIISVDGLLDKKVLAETVANVLSSRRITSVLCRG